MKSLWDGKEKKKSLKTLSVASDISAILGLILRFLSRASAELTSAEPNVRRLFWEGELELPKKKKSKNLEYFYLSKGFASCIVAFF